MTSNRGPDEWFATFADPVRAQSAIGRFMGNSYDLVIDGESYRPRQEPKLDPAAGIDALNHPASDDRRLGRDRSTPESGIIGRWT